MKRIAYILSSVMILILVLYGCDVKKNQILGDSINNIHHTSTASNITHLNKDAEQRNSIKKLVVSDFGVTFNNTFVNIMDSPDKMIELWGRGDVKDDEEAFLHSDPSGKYREYKYRYSAEDAGIEVGVRRGVNDYIWYMGLTNFATKRGIIDGDSYNDMITAYGKPSEEYYDDSDLICDYNFSNKCLSFCYDGDKKINGITIWNYDTGK